MSGHSRVWVGPDGTVRDLDDPSTWAIRPGIDSTPDVTAVVLSHAQCQAIAAVLDRVSEDRARRALRERRGEAA